MAAIPMTPSRFGNSYSGGQAQHGMGALSMADSLPSADFGFNDLRERMAAFTARFDDFIERGRKRVLEERNAFRMNVTELEDTQRHRLQAISNLESQSNVHADMLAKEAQETEEMHSAISSLNQQKEEHLARKSQLQVEIASTQAAIKQRREAQAAHQRSLDTQARHNIPELQFWEQWLGLRIEGAEDGGDKLRFCFSCVDERDAETEAWFELNTAARDFEVVGTWPKLEMEDLDGVLEEANEARQLSSLLKGMRQLFVEALKG